MAANFWWYWAAVVASFKAFVAVLSSTSSRSRPSKGRLGGSDVEEEEDEKRKRLLFCGDKGGKMRQIGRRERLRVRSIIFFSKGVRTTAVAVASREGCSWEILIASNENLPVADFILWPTLSLPLFYFAYFLLPEISMIY